MLYLELRPAKDQLPVTPMQDFGRTDAVGLSWKLGLMGPGGSW